MISREKVNQIVSILLGTECNIDDVSVGAELEEAMTRAQIIKEYGKAIKQIKDGRYYTRYKGIEIMKISFDRVVDEILKRETQEGGRTLDSLAEDFFNYRYINSAGGTYGKDKNNYETFIKGSPIATKDITEIILDDGVKWAKHCLEVKPDMKEKYFKNVRGTLNQMFQYAIDNGLITQNPVSKITIHKDHFAPPTRRQDNELVFTDEERNEVCKLAYEDADHTKSALPFAIPLLFLTGLRDGELCALRWRDIEPKGLHVHAEMVEVRNEEGKFLGYEYKDHTKTPAGDRVIPITQGVEKIFACVKELNRGNKLPIGQDDYIFSRIHDDKFSPCTTRCFETRIKKYCKQAKMETLKSQHDARRTFATNLFYKGMPVKDIQTLMGHGSQEQTMCYIMWKGENTSTLRYLEAISNENMQSAV